MNVSAVVTQLRKFMHENSYSESRLSREAGVAQSTLHRALRNPQRLTKTHIRLCKFAGIALSQDESAKPRHDELMKAVMEVWDGTDEHALSIVRLLRAGATLEAYGARRASKTKNSNGHRH
ncbi:helix-turn-helix domain-containing protein [Hydrogenophaga taeniospiralis]|uniref:helix-turn-helix domain-containing protein n=1 Tax=Hydrogenophaga taeniospiralis TaxID=65656 RepID=UPI001CFA7088|nr:helix-turn-helix transcriptional regulator [Hydrogenophaga taeniospiralis]UCU94928.1 hypothetical protein KI616_03335 [Hydrogenophaga taeniospiralis]